MTSLAYIMDGPGGYCVCICVLVAYSCPILCDPMDCSPPGSSVHGYSPGKNTGVGCCCLLQGIFQTQELSPGPPHCKWILYHLSHQGSPIFQLTFPNSLITLGLFSGYFCQSLLLLTYMGATYLLLHQD